MTNERFLERKLELLHQAIELLKAENVKLRELVDGAREVVEIYHVTFPAQIAWKKSWLEKAGFSAETEKGKS
jgi:restriction endonuclease Mrr